MSSAHAPALRCYLDRVDRNDNADPAAATNVTGSAMTSEPVKDVRHADVDTRGMAAGQSASTLEWDHVRVDVGGVVECDDLCARITRPRGLVLGAPRAVFQVSCGLQPPVTGMVRAVGCNVHSKEGRRACTGVVLDAPMPPTWSALDYVTWSASIAGASWSNAKAAAKRALASMRLGAREGASLSGFTKTARRGVAIAAAIATDASVVLLDDPLAELDDDDARAFAEIIVEALDGRAWVVFAPRIARVSPLVGAAQDAVVFSASHVVAHAAPAELAAAQQSLVVQTDGRADAFGALLAAQGADVLSVQGARIWLNVTHACSAADIFRIACDCDATVLELIPVSRVFT